MIWIGLLPETTSQPPAIGNLQLKVPVITDWSEARQRE